MKGNREHRRGRLMILSAALTGLLLLLGAGQALAAGPALTVGAESQSEPPSVAVDSAGNALIVWSSGQATNLVDYCVLPAKASSCSHSGSLTPAGGENFVARVQALVNGGTYVILADVFGNASTLDGEPLQEWQSTDGGATMVPQAGGLSVGSGIVNGDTVPANGVVLPGGRSLGFGYETASGVPTFNAFPATGATECSRQTCATGYATLEPATNPDPVTNLGAQFTANGDGAMGIFDTNFTSGPLGCSASKAVPFGVAFVFGTGLQSPSNDYNVSPGQPQTAWRTPVTQLDCNVEYPAVGSGPSGFGVLAQNDITGDTIYNRFDEATGKFDTPQAVVDSQGEQQPALSQDGAGGVYATFLSEGGDGPISLAYSADGGKKFTGPTPLDAKGGGGVSDLTSAVNSAGQGFAAWLKGGSVHAQTFQAADAVAPATVAPTATSTSTTITLAVTCAVFPCTITLTLSGPESILVNAHGPSQISETAHPKRVTLGTGTFKIKSEGAKHLKLKLSRTGQRALAGHHGTLKLSLGVAEKALGTTVKSTRSVRVTLPKTKKRK